MHTFYVPSIRPNADTVEISDLEHHHLRNVLRLKKNDVVQIIDGKGNVYSTKVNRISEESTIAQITDQEHHEKKTPFLMLFQGIPKNDKMELILQKTTELGVSQIVPMITERTLQKPSENRLKRWNRIVISATKQCKRLWLPELQQVKEFDACINTCIKTLATDAITLILWEKRKKQSIRSVLKSNAIPKSIALFVGPEGGFTDNEVNEAVNKGCIPVTIGANTLRTETAAIASIAIAAYEYRL